MIEVKILEMNAPVRTYSLESGATIQQLADVDYDETNRDILEGTTITLNHAPMTSESKLYHDCRIFVSRATKGNIPFEVQIIRMGAGTVGVAVEDGYTIKQAIQELGDDSASYFNADGSDVYEYRVGGSGQPVQSSHVIQRPTSGTVRLILSQRMKGNS